MEITTKKESAIKKDGINVILDIYNVLLHQRCGYITDVHQFFLNKSFVVQDSAGDNYIVPAYLPEFLNFVMSRFNISFFSNIPRKRNISVIQNIWLKAFGTSKPEGIQALGRKDLTYAGDDKELQPYVGGEYWDGNYKKDIRKLGALHNTILVDEGNDWVLKGQEFNFLSVPSANFYNFKLDVEFYENRDNYSQLIEKLLVSKHGVDDSLAFYKLLYIAGVLDIVAEHETSIIDGLYAIQFEDDVPKFYKTERYLQYYKRGYRVLLKCSMAEQQKTILHLLYPHSEIYWFVLPPEMRQLIVGYMIQLTKQKMCLFPEIEKHFC